MKRYFVPISGAENEKSLLKQYVDGTPRVQRLRKENVEPCINCGIVVYTCLYLILLFVPLFQCNTEHHCAFPHPATPSLAL